MQEFEKILTDEQKEEFKKMKERHKSEFKKHRGFHPEMLKPEPQKVK